MFRPTKVFQGGVTMRAIFILCLAVAFFSAGSIAKADTIGSLTLTDCGSGSGCPGATYAFDITSTSATLTITINGVPTSSNNYIGSVDLGFTPSSNVSGLALASAPSALGNWSAATGSLSSNGGGCGGNGGAFVCSTALPSNPLLISQGGVYSWTWTYNAINPSQISSSVHVGAQYGPNANGGWKGLIISQVVSTPEPSSLALLAVGMLGFLGVAAKKLVRA
jgi:hypothetical protein